MVIMLEEAEVQDMAEAKVLVDLVVALLRLLKQHLVLLPLILEAGAAP